MKPEVTLNGKPLEDMDPHEFDPMVKDTLDQLETLRYNETVDRNPEPDEFGIDRATD